MKFLVDMPLSPALANWLVTQGHDAVHASQLGMHRAADELIMEMAGQEHRVLITADLDYPRILALALANGPGLILFRGGDFNERSTTDGKTQESSRVSCRARNEEFDSRHRKGPIRKRRLPIQRT